MAYDALVESVRLIEHGLPDAPGRLSRRRRFAPVAVDVDGDIAVTMFVRRGVNGELWRDNHALCRRRGGWHVLGGGSGNAAAGLLRDRPVGHRGLWVSTGGGGTNRDAGRVLPFPAPRFIRYVTLQVVDVVDVVGSRQIVVPWHGTVCVVWQTRRPPTLSLLDIEGSELERLDVSTVVGPRSPVIAFRTPWRRRRRHPAQGERRRASPG